MSMPSLKASIHGVSDDFRSVHDLNFDLFICDTFGLIRTGLIMNNGKTLFAQVMEWYSMHPQPSESFG